MNHIRPSAFSLAASDVLVPAGTRYRPLISRADGLIITRADKPAAPIYFSFCDLSQRLENGTLTIERNNEPSEVSHA